jgi:hypothetical protein
VRRRAGRLEGFEAMKNRLEGVQHLRVLGSAVAGPDGVAAAGAVTSMLTRALATWSTLSSWRTLSLGARPCFFAWEGKSRSEGVQCAFLTHDNVATLAYFTNEE